MEDDHIDKLEQEANLKGTMTFRNWTDSLNENKDPFGLNSHIHKLFEDLEEPIINKEMTTKEFIDTVNDEFDVETLELMQGLIDKRLTLLNTMTDVATKKQIKGFKRYN
jgi:hypothetical protein